ncbi:MAG TPA: hypothetical protein VFS44_04045 [Gemmatimonadaceae bacterium]|nr:hypothetical protein [Gemmatimonadaceae bacterium]
MHKMTKRQNELRHELEHLNTELAASVVDASGDRPESSGGVASDARHATRVRRDAVRRELGTALGVEIDALEAERIKVDTKVRREASGAARARMRTQLRDLGATLDRLRHEFQLHETTTRREAGESTTPASGEARAGA